MSNHVRFFRVFGLIFVLFCLLRHKKKIYFGFFNSLGDQVVDIWSKGEVIKDSYM